MKNIIKKIISFLLIITLFVWTSLNSFWFNSNIKNDIKDYNIILEKESSFWKIYYITEKYESRAISPWDVADVIMAWDSWAELFNEPSWSNFWWAILDTAAIAPLVPSTSWIRKWWKKVLKDDALKNLSKKDKEKVKKAIKEKWPKIENRKKIWKFYYNDTAIKRLNDTQRKIEESDLEKIINTWTKLPDPKWQPWFFEYTKNDIIKTWKYPKWKLYKVKIIYNPKTNTIQHFHYENV